MKQHITGQQYNELSEKGEERLCQWNEERGGVYDVQNLSIGQMIEFLAIHHHMGYDKFTFHLQDIKQSKYVLCDKLWEAVKEILDKP